jgi:ABC-2 type transport system ATP-binding protein
MIVTHNITKSFTSIKKKPGLVNSVKSLFHREYTTKTALNNISLSVSPGEILGLIGANGAGKTTLVKILSGIIHPTSGSAQVLGYTPWERKNEFRRNIALIMGQKAQLWWDLPASDCFILLKEIYQIEDSKFKNSLDYLVSTLNISYALNTQMRQLSLGERMKMELIAALIHEPKVVFLDEPTIGLDITSQRAIRKFILEYRLKHHPMMILTSHYMEDIEQLCSRVAIIKDGGIVYDGSLSELINKHVDYKIIKLLLKDTLSVEPNLPQELGTLAKVSDSEYEIKVPRSKILACSEWVTKNIPFLDLTIKEEEISTLIEKIMNR